MNPCAARLTALLVLACTGCTEQPRAQDVDPGDADAMITPDAGGFTPDADAERFVDADPPDAALPDSQLPDASPPDATPPARCAPDAPILELADARLPIPIEIRIDGTPLAESGLTLRARLILTDVLSGSPYDARVVEGRPGHLIAEIAPGTYDLHLENPSIGDCSLVGLWPVARALWIDPGAPGESLVFDLPRSATAPVLRQEGAPLPPDVIGELRLTHETLDLMVRCRPSGDQATLEAWLPPTEGRWLAAWHAAPPDNDLETLTTHVLGSADLGEVDLMIDRGPQTLTLPSPVTITLQLALNGQPVGPDDRDNPDLVGWVDLQGFSEGLYRIPTGPEGLQDEPVQLRVLPQRYGLTAFNNQLIEPPWPGWGTRAYGCPAGGCLLDADQLIQVDLLRWPNRPAEVAGPGDERVWRLRNGQVIPLSPVQGRVELEADDLGDISLDGATIIFTSADGPPLGTSTRLAEGGSFEVQLPAGQYRVSLAWMAGLPDGPLPDLVEVQEGLTELHLSVALDWLEGEVTLNGQQMPDDPLLDGEPRGFIHAGPLLNQIPPRLPDPSLGEVGPARFSVPVLRGHRPTLHLITFVPTVREMVRPASQGVLPMGAMPLAPFEAGPTGEPQVRDVELVHARFAVNLDDPSDRPVVLRSLGPDGHQVLFARPEPGESACIPLPPGPQVLDLITLVHHTSPDDLVEGAWPNPLYTGMVLGGVDVQEEAVVPIAP